MLLALVIGDLHGRIDHLASMTRFIKKEEIDAVFLTGDIGANVLLGHGANDYSTKTYLKTLEAAFEICCYLGKKVFFVPGNWDLANIPRSPKSNVYNVDILGSGEISTCGSYQVVGIGGGRFINGDFPYEWAPEQINTIANTIHESLSPEKPTILISHHPPFQCKIDLNNARSHQGESNINKVIIDVKPTLFISGHIHEAVGVDYLEPGVPCIGAGSFVKSQPIKMQFDTERIDLNIENFPQFFLTKIDAENLIFIRHLIGSGYHNRIHEYKIDETGVWQWISEKWCLIPSTWKNTNERKY
ncbi:MAG: metallophosphoesterase [Candidatus Heimdallarchaeota archaeon]|nr:metallophosphoesterase [Candidatus Heimdallarchaeota archaeon]